MKYWLFSAVSLLALVATVPSQAITVDGNASDWGITVQNGPLGGGVGSSYLPGPTAYSGPGTTGLIAGTPNPHSEDSDDRAGTASPLGPHAGGQDYDAQYMAVALSTPTMGTLANSTIYILISTGMRPDNGASLFGIGDIRIKAGPNSAPKYFGIETGGGLGAAVTEGVGNGNNFVLAGNGTTTAMVGTPVGGAGTVFATPDASDWLLDPIPADGPPASHEDDRNQLNYGAGGVDGSNIVAVADYIYTANTLTNSGVDDGGAGDQGVHALIELALPAAPFLSTDGFGNQYLVFDITWGPSCNNDILHVETGLVPLLITTPEPGTLAALGFGLASLGGIPLMRRRRRD
jgi:hypothetical protein